MTLSLSRRVWLSAVLLTLLATGGAFGADAPYGEQKWAADFEGEIQWQQLTDAGYLVVCTSTGLFGLDPATGQQAWAMDDVRKLPDDYFEILPATQFALVTKKSGPLGAMTQVVLVDVIDGKLMWTSKEMGLTNTNGQFYLPQAGGVLFFGTNEKGKATFLLADLVTGQPVWTSQTLFKGSKGPEQFTIRPEKKTGRMGIGGNQYPVWLSDGTFLEFMSKNGLRKINAKTGEQVWASKFKFKDVPGLRNGYGPMLLSPDEKVVYVPHDNTIDAVSTTDGTPLWKKTPKLISMATQMQLTEQGLVVKGGGGPKNKPFITVLDPQTGETVWKKPFRDLADASSFAVKDGKILLYADRSICSINIADAEATEVARKISFEGGEVPGSLQLLDTGYLLVSDQNVALFDWEGNQVFHSYHKAPGASMFSKITSTVATATVNAMSAAAAYSEAHSEAQASGHGSASYMVASNSVMSRRFKASASAQNYHYVLTNVEGGSSGSRANAGIVKVDKTNGQDVRRVALGTKKPEYEVDPIDNQLYFIEDGKRIICYDL
ncbi:PQQ-binding-like beta-propeller repeat protein [bacterium]|nr:PQQ-binding-like beta-propeller repeat protein [bacterium]MBU1983536.1 PQQ-binding-like beta-propeller repeat protein [bacterium]